MGLRVRHLLVLPPAPGSSPCSDVASFGSILELFEMSLLLCVGEGRSAKCPLYLEQKVGGLGRSFVPRGVCSTIREWPLRKLSPAQPSLALRAQRSIVPGSGAVDQGPLELWMVF